MRRRPLLLIAAALVLPAAGRAQVEIDSNTFGGLEARALGPAVMSGRVSSLDVAAGETLTVYVGTAGGGVWKSEDGGNTFEPVFDDHAQAIGAVRIDPNDPQTVWVGSGESWTRRGVAVGDGVYKTTDGGESWRNMGLAAAGRIARIQVSPEDGDTVSSRASPPPSTAPTTWGPAGNGSTNRSTSPTSPSSSATSWSIPPITTGSTSRV